MRYVILGFVGAVAGAIVTLFYGGIRLAAAAAPAAPPSFHAGPMGGVDDQARIVSAVARDEPSVVALDVVVNGKRFVPADPFAQLFGSGGNGQMQPYREEASGSGFVYARNGLIATNAHVVQFGQGADVKITAVFKNGDRIPAHVYAANPQADLALVKVDNYAKLPPPVQFADSSRLQAGQWAIAIGEPFELQAPWPSESSPASPAKSRSATIRKRSSTASSEVCCKPRPRSIWATLAARCRR